MSIKIMSRIWESGPENMTERFVLLALADNASDDGKCWPSIEMIRRKTCMSERGVQGVLKRLEAGGWLSITPNAGRGHCNLYHIKTPHDVHPAADAPRRSLQENPAPRAPRTVREPSYREDTNVSSLSIVQKPQESFLEPEGTDFEAFWATVPRKVAKGTARKAWARAVKKAPPETIIAGMRRYARQREGKDAEYTAHPATWLNGERWLDEGGGNSYQDFHDRVAAMLKDGGNDELSGENAGDRGSVERFPALFRASQAPGR